MRTKGDERAGEFDRARWNDCIDGFCDWFDSQRSLDGADFAQRASAFGEAMSHLRSELLRELAASDFERRRRTGQSPAVKDYAHWLDGAGMAWLAERCGQFTAPTSVLPAIAPAPIARDSENQTRAFLGAEVGSAAHTVDLPPSQSLPAKPKRNAERIGRYEVERRIGHGGMGIVYEARCDDIDRRVALKVMRDPLSDERSRARFERERDLLARLEHPNVARLVDAGYTADQLPFYAMEFVEGRRLDDWCDERQLSTRDRVALIVQVCEAVAAAHRAGIVHRDIKPANVLVSTTGVVKVVDFGLAKPLNEATEFTASNQLLGTPSFMAPEQAGGFGSAISPATDVYGIGATLYRLLGGRAPFVGDIARVIEQVLQDEPLSLRRLNAELPRDLETICRQCLNKDPKRRYVDAAALAEELRRFLDGRPISARPISALERTWKWCKRRPLPAAALAAAALASVGMWIAFARTLVLQRAIIGANQKLLAGQKASGDEYNKVHELFGRFDKMFPKDKPQPYSPPEARRRVLREFQRHYQEAIDIWSLVADRFPDEPEFRRGLLNRSLDLGRSFRLDERLDKMMAAWEGGLIHAERLAALTEFAPNETFVAGRLCYNLAVEAYHSRHYERSREFSAKALQWVYKGFDPMVARQEPDFKWFVIAGEYYQAKALMRLGNARAALPHLASACRYAADDMLVACQAVQAVAMAIVGDAAGAVALIENLSKLQPANEELALSAAETMAIVAKSATNEAEKARWLGAAKRHFQRAVDNGILNDPFLRTDVLTLDSLEILRKQPDIAKLIEARSPKGK